MPPPLRGLASCLLLAFWMTPHVKAQAVGSKAWVVQQVGKLADPDPSARKAARDALEREAGRSGSPASFLKDLNDALIPWAKSHNVRERIAAGVVAEQIAAKSPSPALEGIAQTLMESDSDATALIGMKVAKALLPATLSIPKDPMAAAVVASMKAHPDSGEIAEEAYGALTLQAGRKNGPPPAGAIAAAVPAVLNLVETRIATYGEHAPPKPAADGRVAAFLAIEAWPAVSGNAPMANRILRDLGDLLCAQSRVAAEGNSDRALAEARHQTGQSLQVTGGASLQSAAEDLMKPLDGVAPDEVDRRCAALDAAMPAGAKLTRAKR